MSQPTRVPNHPARVLLPQIQVPHLTFAPDRQISAQQVLINVVHSFPWKAMMEFAVSSLRMSKLSSLNIRLNDRFWCFSTWRMLMDHFLAQCCRSCAEYKITKRQVGLLSVAGVCLSACAQLEVSHARIPTDTMLRLRDPPRRLSPEDAFLGSYRQRQKGGHVLWLNM